MKLRDVLESDVYFNHVLADAYESRSQGKSEHISLLVHELTWTGEKRTGTVEKRLGVEFEDINPNNHIKKSSNIDNWSYWGGDLEKKLEDIKQGMAYFGLSENCSLEDYVSAGKRALNELQLPYCEFSTEKVKAYMNVAEDQQKAFKVDVYNLAIGQLAEQAMREFLIVNNKEFISRSFLFHNSWKKQDEKDIKIFMEDGEKDLGVRCQREFSGAYLYSKKRVFDQRDKIGDYIIFFNHLAHHLFYITGVVSKEFLSKPKESFCTTNSPMEIFSFPESETVENFVSNYEIPVINRTEKEIIADVNTKLRQRINLGSLFSMLK